MKRAEVDDTSCEATIGMGEDEIRMGDVRNGGSRRGDGNGSGDGGGVRLLWCEKGKEAVPATAQKNFPVTSEFMNPHLS